MSASNFRKRVTLISLVTLFLTGSIVSIPAVAHADVLQETECFPAVLMLKGSGEGEGILPEGINYKPVTSTSPNAFIHTNGHEGQTLGRLLQSFVNETDPAETVSKVRFVGIKTPSLPVAPTIPKISGVPDFLQPGPNSVTTAALWVNHVIEYNESYRSGAQMVLDFIKEDEEQRHCNTQYMLLSYSQGVISARLAMNLLGNNTDKVISSYVMGDPFQKGYGANSERQFTEANSSPNTDGIARVAVNTLIKVGELKNLVGGGGVTDPTNNLFSELTKYRDEIVGADHFIYRDEGEDGIVSRSLCHKDDPTCDFSVLGAEEHLNYFDAGKEAGALDIQHEVAEFDKQVRVLANKATSNPRERTLAKSPSLTGGTTSYNVADARPDDKCSWDENSDGTQELVDVPCKVHNVNHVGTIAKMTVTVTDSFGITYPPLGSEVTTLDPEIVDKVTGLDPNTWYQFEVYNAKKGSDDYWGPNCLQWSHFPLYSITEAYYTNLSSYYACSDNPMSSVMSSTYVFKASPHQTPDGMRTRMLSGLDKNHAWQAGGEYNAYRPEIEDFELSQDITVLPMSSDPKQNIDAKVSRIIDEIPYYSFKMDGKCVTFMSPGQAAELQDCNPNNTNQLFFAQAITEGFDDTSAKFGDLTIESDTKAPSNVTGLRVETDSETVNLKWDESRDERGGSIEYRVYKKNGTSQELEFIDNAWRGASFEIDTEEGVSNTYEVLACDYAGNCGAPGSLTFVMPSHIARPDAPILESINDNPASVSLSFPGYPAEGVRGIRIYKNGQYLTTTTGANFVDHDVDYYGFYVYSYALEISDNVSSAMSDDIWFSMPSDPSEGGETDPPSDDPPYEEPPTEEPPAEDPPYSDWCSEWTPCD